MDHKLAKILWQVAKMLASLLEKEYGLGSKCKKVEKAVL